MSFDHRSWKIRYNANKFSGSAVERNSSTMRVKAEILAPEGTSIRRGRTPPVASIAQDARRTRYACAAADGGGGLIALNSRCTRSTLRYARFRRRGSAWRGSAGRCPLVFSSVGSRNFPRRKSNFHTSEMKIPYVGNFRFQRWKSLPLGGRISVLGLTGLRSGSNGRLP